MSPQYRSPLNSIAVSSTSEAAFLSASLRHYTVAYLKTLVRPGALLGRGTRTPRSVGANYDRERGAMLDRVADMGWDEVMYGGNSSEPDFVLVDDRIVWEAPRVPMSRLLEHLTRVVASHCSAGDIVMEFGCGNGRNLFHLKTQFAEIRFIGLELSPLSVDLARALATKFGLDVAFHVSNVCEPLPREVRDTRAALVFSRHALEMMPRIFPGAIRNMCAVCDGQILLLEPVPELWPRTARGLTSRLRVRAHDRLRGLMPALPHAAPSWVVRSARHLGVSRNPLNETCEVRLERR